MVRDTATVTGEHHYEVIVADRSVSVPMTLSNLERRSVTGQNFWQIILHNYARMVQPGMTEFSTI